MIVDVLPNQPGEADGIRLLARKPTGCSFPAGQDPYYRGSTALCCAAASRPQPQHSPRPVLSLDTSKAARPPRSLRWPHLARDNGYRMVIVIAGTSDPLFLQTRSA